MRVACYCRVSTKKDDQLDSLKNQIEFFRELTNGKGYELYNIYADKGVSGKQLKNRLEFQKMMKDARLKQFDAILVKDITRFSRNVIDFLTSIRELKQLGINMFFTSYDMNIKEADETYLTMMAVFAEDESRRLSIKTKFGKNITAKKGRVPNFVFGYDKVDRYNLKPNPDEAKVVRKIFHMYIYDRLGTARIADWLTKNKVKTKKNKQTGWSQKTVLDILRNKIYIGKVINKKSEVTDFISGKRKTFDIDDHLIINKPNFAIIDEEVFYMAQEILNERTNNFKIDRKRESSKYTFSNLITCSECGYSFRRCQHKYSESGNLHVWWVCSYRNAHGTDSCINSIRVNDDELINAITLFFKQFLVNKKHMSRQITNMIKSMIEQNKKHDSESPEILQKRLDKLSSEKEKYMDMYKNDIINMGELKTFTSNINEEIQELKNKLSMFSKEIFLTDEEIQKYVEEYLNKVEVTIGHGNLDNQHLKEIIDKIVIKPDGTVNIIIKLDSEGKITSSIPLEVIEIDLPTIHLDTSFHKDVTKWVGTLRVS